MAEVSGLVSPGYEAVRDAFAANFDEFGDIGASCCVYRDGIPVLDISGGVTEAGGDRPYRRDDLQLIFSSTKGATAICAHMLAERGELDLDAPVAEYWPEFGTAGKADIPVRWLLTHKSGLIDVDRAMSFEEALDWTAVAQALAESKPVWEPGTQHGYHAVTFGFLVGEIVRRVSGRSLGTFFRDEVATPLGLDFWIGLPDEQVDRVVPLVEMGPPPGIQFGEPGDPQPGLVQMLAMIMGADSLITRALTAPGGAFSDEHNWNSPQTWQAELPAANGITNAASLARMYAATVGEIDGVRLLSEATVKAATVRQTEGPDAVLVFELPFGSGFMLDGPLIRLGGPAGFGHYGAGGSVGFADPERGLGFAYVMNKMELGIAGDPRTARLIDALYGVV